MKIIYETETGIAIIYPSGEISIEEVFEKDVPQKYMSTAKIVEDNIIPSDRTFRGSWKIDKDKIIEDIEKSKEIWKEKLRSERKPMLESLDVEVIKANEKGLETSDIITEKQRLRDITKLLDVCKTISDIKNVTL